MYFRNPLIIKFYFDFELDRIDNNVKFLTGVFELQSQQLNDVVVVVGAAVVARAVVGLTVEVAGVGAAMQLHLFCLVFDI